MGQGHWRKGLGAGLGVSRCHPSHSPLEADGGLHPGPAQRLSAVLGL